MEESNLTTGGHALFYHYQQGMTDYLVIALVQETEAVTMTEELALTAVNCLDLGPHPPGRAHQRERVAKQSSVEALHLVPQGQAG